MLSFEEKSLQRALTPPVAEDIGRGKKQNLGQEQISKGVIVVPSRGEGGVIRNSYLQMNYD